MSHGPYINLLEVLNFDGKFPKSQVVNLDEIPPACYHSMQFEILSKTPTVLTGK